jgi:hypothetical protein
MLVQVLTNSSALCENNIFKFNLETLFRIFNNAKGIADANLLACGVG